MYRHTPEMGEISGFGGGYENACQDMLEAGVKWLQENQDVRLKAKGVEGVFGFFEPTSKEAKRLEAAMLVPVTDEEGESEISGAMHHAVMSRLFWIAHHGWDAYCEELTNKNATA